MKLVRYGAAGKEKPGIIDSKGKIRDLSKIVKDIDGEALSPAGLAKIKKANIDKLPLVKGNPRLGQADEFGAACAFLCSAHAGFITGQNLLMDGGVFPGAF